MKNLLVLIFFLACIIGCQKLKMDIPDSGRKLAINGIIASDEFLNLRITESQYITNFESENDFSIYDLRGAEVLFFQKDVRVDSLQHVPGEDVGQFMEWWHIFSNSNYRSKSIMPGPGEEYKVVVKFSGLPDASATTVIPDLVKIESVDTSRITLAPGTYYESSLGLRCKINFSDPGNQSNFYLFRGYFNTYYQWESGATYHQSQNLVFTSEDPIIEENIYGVNGLMAFIFSDKVINGQTYNLDITIKGESIGNPLYPGVYSSIKEYRKAIYFKLYSITEEYFKYLKTLYEYSQTYGNPLAEPVLVNSNVTGGYGMFTGAAVSADSIVFQY
jgi:hypothetical protein